MSKRKVWFIARPERDPTYHRDALKALWDSTDEFSVKWKGNREAHKEYERILVLRNLKRDNISDSGSGGRTWAAMLRTFAYVYINEDGYLELTKVGKKILEGEKVKENITKQIMTLQIPNAYFCESGFRPKFGPEFRIRPARFLIKLAHNEKLDFHLTKEEITYFVLTATNDNQLDEIADKILCFRNASEKERKEMKIEIAKEYDHRERSDKGARDYENAHGDVAHTFMMICDYTGLVEYVRGESVLRADMANLEKNKAEIERYDLRYPFNKRYLISLQRMAENNGLDVDSYKASQYGDIKPASNKTKAQRKIIELLKNYPDPTSLSENRLLEILGTEFPSREAEKHVQELLKNRRNALNEEFVEGYLTERDDFQFENKTGEIFRALGFEVVMRPKPVANASTQIEILLKTDGNRLVLVDAKNHRPKFSLPASLASHMASEYLPNYEGYDGGKIEFFGYVVAGDFSGEKNLRKISSLAKRFFPERDVKGFMVSANSLIGFLDYCIDNGIEPQERSKLFLYAIENRGYKTPGELIKAIKKGSR